MAFGRLEHDAIEKWWKSYGRSWHKTRVLANMRGWDLEDVKQEVLLSALTKSQGKSAFDPTRCDVGGWASIVGRSRILHLLERRTADLPLSAMVRERDDGSSFEVEAQAVEWLDPKSDLGSVVPRSEVRVSLGLDPEFDQDEQDRCEAMGIDTLSELFDIF